MDVPERHRFDVGALAEYLKGKLPDFDGQLRVELFKGGQSNPTYKLYGSRRNFVMRAKPGPVAKLLPSAHAIEREFRVLQALGKTDVPVAEDRKSVVQGERLELGGRRLAHRKETHVHR